MDDLIAPSPRAGAAATAGYGATMSLKANAESATAMTVNTTLV
jgi:hypothetical protein